MMSPPHTAHLDYLWALTIATAGAILLLFLARWFPALWDLAFAPCLSSAVWAWVTWPEEQRWRGRTG
jgi:hypothetical protein